MPDLIASVQISTVFDGFSISMPSRSKVAVERCISIIAWCIKSMRFASLVIFAAATSSNWCHSVELACGNVVIS